MIESEWKVFEFDTLFLRVDFGLRFSNLYCFEEAKVYWVIVVVDNVKFYFRVFWCSLGMRVSAWTRMIFCCLNLLLRGRVYVAWCCRRRIAGICRIWSFRWFFCESKTLCVRTGQLVRLHSGSSLLVDRASPHMREELIFPADVFSTLYLLYFLWFWLTCGLFYVTCWDRWGDQGLSVWICRVRWCRIRWEGILGYALLDVGLSL